jgi:hypothetical protein
MSQKLVRAGRSGVYIMLPTYHGYVQPMASEIAHGNIYKTRKKTRRKEKVMIVSYVIVESIAWNRVPNGHSAIPL